MERTRARCWALILVIFIAIATPSAGQEMERASVGVAVAGLGLYDESGRPAFSPGIGSWFDAQVAGPLSIEGQVLWFPTQELQIESQGGQTLKVMGGVRGLLLDSRRLRLSGILEPGVIRFSGAATGEVDGAKTVGPRTHFALDLGLALEMFPRSRLSPRIDVTQTMYVVPGIVLGAATGAGAVNAAGVLPGQVADTIQISAGIAYRIGSAPQEVSNGSRDALGGPVTVGAQFAYGIRETLGELSPLSDPGLGAFVSYRLLEWLHLDGALNTYTQASEVTTPWDGGRVTQGLAGVKVGVRRQGIGLFVKTRAGVNSHSEAFAARDSAPLRRTLVRSNVPVIEVGGIVEIETGRRMHLRFDAGHLTAFYDTRSILLDGVPVEQPAPESTASIQMAVGVGWRF